MPYDPKKLKVVYQPGGRAREYNPLACNLYTGCTHGCSYCYVPGVLRKDRREFHAAVMPRKNVLENLRRDCDYLAGQHCQDEIMLCFTCDPYWSRDEADTILTRDALRIIGESGLRATVLTKGGLRASRDFDMLKTRGFSFGTSLCWMSESDAYKHEPGAALVDSRIAAIKAAHALGIFTWVSMEPVIDPAQALALVRFLFPIVDLWKVGKLNHFPDIEQEVDWPKFRENLTATLKSVGAKYVIKRDLLEAK